MDKNEQNTQSSPLLISPISDNSVKASLLHRHVKEIELIIQNLLKIKRLEYSNTPLFLKEFELLLPLLLIELPDDAPGEITISLTAKFLKRHHAGQFLLEMIQRWLLPWGQAEIISTKQMPFCFTDFPKRHYFTCEVTCLVEDEAALLAIREKIPLFSQEVRLGALSSHHAKHILLTQGLTTEQKTSQIHKTIIELANSKMKTIAPDVFFEMHHFLLACDDEFKRLRDVKHMCRIICYHNWYRRLFREEAFGSEPKERHIRFKLMKTPLRFTFGEKRVIGIVIGVNFISDYEQFGEKHILKACQRLIAQVRFVPHSFFCYTSPSDTIHSYYLEIEKKDGKDFSVEELKLLQNGIEHELSLSIEQLSHKLFMPHNEEEVLRSTLLLGQELRTIKDPPQIIANFRAQTESTLTFHIILVRVLEEGPNPSIETLFQTSSDLLTFISGSKKTIGLIRNKNAKEANTFLLECPKAPFLRQDHSVDLLRAREFIVSSVGKLLGDVRDYNGGLISQQNQLLNNLKELLTSRDLKHELHLDNLFHSITPVLMKSLVAPELIRTLFHLFTELYQSNDEETLELRYKELRLEHSLCFMISSDDKNFFDELNKAIADMHLRDLEIASTSFKIGSVYYQGYILVPQETETILQFSKIVNHKLSSYRRLKHLGQTLKISLPRPTSLLDPRIGTDRTSGIVIKMLYEGLVRIDSNGKPSLALAEKIDISSDGKTYVFQLRPTKWSNGKAVTAYDFEYAWKRLLDPNFKSLYAYLFYPIKNAKQAKKGYKSVDEVGIIAKDANTLRVELESPAPYFLELTAHWIYSPLCKETDELHPGWAYYGGENFVCNGPFRLSKWKRNSEIQAIKNPLYWDAEFVHLRRIDISIIENPKLAHKAFERDELDWIGEPLSEIPPELFRKKETAEKIQSHPIAAVHWYDCNVKIAPFESKKCRQALSLAINRQAIIDEVLTGQEQPAYSILPPSLSLAKRTNFQEQDAELARKLFQEGLEEQGLKIKDLPRLTITCFDQQLNEQVAAHMAKQWKEVLGLDFSVKSYTWERFMQKCLQYDFHIMGTTWYSWFNDPLYNLEHMKYQTGDMNTSQWQNERYIELLDQASACLDMKERKKLLQEAEAIVTEEMPIIPVFYYTFKYMKKEHVHNIFLSHLGQIDFKWAYVNQPK
jgi:oligopeptide transport system substrate-binding protein